MPPLCRAQVVAEELERRETVSKTLSDIDEITFEIDDGDDSYTAPCTANCCAKSSVTER